jgi:hypothetical protein
MSLGARLRKLRNRIRALPLWIKQGRPRRLPVVITRGEVVSCRHGYALVQNWAWDFSYQRGGPIEVGHMIDILGAQYGVRRVGELSGCPACEGLVTA